MRRDRDNAEVAKRVDELKQQLAELRQGAGPQAEQMRNPPAHDTNGYASYTPVSDGKNVWVCFGTGVVVCYDFDGKHYLYTARGELIRAADGEKLPSQDFTLTAKPWAFFNTPSVIGNRIYCAHGSGGEEGEAHALEIPETAELLEKNGLKKVWSKQVSKNRYYSSPLLHEGIVCLISREYQMQALDADTGDELYSERIRGFAGTSYPSLTLAGDVIFVGAEDGNAAFVKPGREFSEIARTKVDPYRSTPIFNGEWSYLRTHDKLRAFRAE